MVAGIVLMLAVSASRVAAQTTTPLRGVVADLRAVSTTVPTGPGWTPPLSTGVVPGRGFGGEVGVTAFVGPGRGRRAFLGATAMLAEGRATGEDAPTVTTRLRAAAPQVGLGFGHGEGWSYLSAGAGAVSVRSDTDTDPATEAPWTLAVHYGGGARWFLSEHVAFALDLRFWALTPRAATPTRVSGAATTRIALGAGVSFR